MIELNKELSLNTSNDFNSLWSNQRKLVTELMAPLSKSLLEQIPNLLPSSVLPTSFLSRPQSNGFEGKLPTDLLSRSTKNYSINNITIMVRLTPEQNV